MKLFRYSSVIILGLIPFLANAQSIDELLDTASSAINQIIPILIGLALVVFFWGLIQFIVRSGNKEAVENGRRLMLWGIISLFIMVGIWGIIAIAADVLNVGVGGSATPPTVDCTYFEGLGEECPQ